MREAAQKILGQLREGFPGAREYARADLSDFPHLDRSFYERAGREASRLGFEPICDLVDLTATGGEPDPRTLVRVLCRPSDGATFAIYHFKPRLRWRLLMLLGRYGPTRIYELETELSDGALLQTSTIGERSKAPAPDSFRRRYLDSTKLSVEEVVREHTRAVAEYMDSHPGAEPVPQRSFEDVVAAQNRAAARRREHLRSIGWVTRDYLLQFAGIGEKLVDQLLEEIQQIVAEEEAGGAVVGASRAGSELTDGLAAAPSTREELLSTLAERGLVVLTTVPDESGEFEWLDYEEGRSHIFPLFTSEARAQEFGRTRVPNETPPAGYAALAVLTLEPGFLWSQDLSAYELRLDPGSEAETVLTAADVERLRELVEAAAGA